MTLELIVFIAAILFGIVWFWRESKSNSLYRFFNKLMNAKPLQMSPDDPTGFVFQQKLVLRLVFITALFLVGILVTRFVIPIDIATISVFASMIVGTLLGTYIGGFVLKSEKVIDAKSDSIEGKFQETIEKGKDFLDDLTGKKDDIEVISKDIEAPSETQKPQEKSARERLKDKGLM
uniref:hypothetical protein n=1 Tax=Gelidibacter sp. TaxID=2018083 RepID=UPI00404A90BE